MLWPRGRVGSSPTPGTVTVTFRQAGSDDADRTFEIWRDAVDATHDFLSREDREAIAAEVAEFLPAADLTLAVDVDDHPLGFMLVAEGKLEALFVAPESHGAGVGRALVELALESNPGLVVDVNEQNPAAIGFYERMGFHATGRSPLDEQGRAYPLIHMRHGAATE